MASASSSVSGVHSESDSNETKPKIKEEQDVSSENTTTEQPKNASVRDVPVVNMERLDKEALARDIEFLEKRQQEKLKKNAADFTQYLTEKYFSDKTIFGDNIFDVKTTADGKTIKTSSLPPYQSYADPAGFLDLLKGVVNIEKKDPAETSTANKDPAEASTAKKDPAEASTVTEETKKSE